MDIGQRSARVKKRKPEKRQIVWDAIEKNHKSRKYFIVILRIFDDDKISSGCDSKRVFIYKFKTVKILFSQYYFGGQSRILNYLLALFRPLSHSRVFKWNIFYHILQHTPVSWRQFNKRIIYWTFALLYQIQLTYDLITLTAMRFNFSYSFPGIHTSSDNL